MKSRSNKYAFEKRKNFDALHLELRALNVELSASEKCPPAILRKTLLDDINNSDFRTIAFCKSLLSRKFLIFEFLK